jgi:Transposase, Mutator family
MTIPVWLDHACHSCVTPPPQSACSSRAGLPGDHPPLGDGLGRVRAFAYSPEIRKVIYSTNAIESVHARLRRSVRARGHFPTEQAAIKCLYLAVRSLDPTGRGQQRWTTRWKPALNAFAITFEGRLANAVN